MAGTIRSATPTAVRTVTYQGANSSVQLDYCNYTVSTRQVDVARGAIKRIYRFSFQFILSGANSSELNDIMTNVERTLKQRAGILTITEGGVDIFRCGPAQGPTTNAAGPSIVDRSVRTTLLSDVEWGPTPVSVALQSIGVGAYGTWVLDVTVPAEDAFVIGDLIVLGVDAEVSYALDQNHYTTRTVVGRVYVGNWGRSAADPFGRNKLSQADAEPIRLALLSPQQNYTTSFMTPVRIPPNFVRAVQTFTVDATENVLNFIIVDREVYRLYPTYITDADAQMSVHIAGASAVQYVRHVLSGYCESPRDVDKGRVLQACWEQIQDAIGPLLTREANGHPAFVHTVNFTNHIYRNRIDYQLLLYTPFGAYNFFNSLAIGNFRSSVFFPQMVGGSAQLFGSGYRLEDPKARTGKDVEAASPKNEQGSSEDPTSDNQKEADAIGKQEVLFNMTIYQHGNQNTRASVPNTKGALAEAYQTNEADFGFLLDLKAVFVNRRGTAGEQDYYVRFLDQLNQAFQLGISFTTIQTIAQTTRKGVLGPNDLVKVHYRVNLFLRSDLRKQVIEAGGASAFTSALQQEFNKGNNDSLPDAIKKFISGGQQ